MKTRDLPRALVVACALAAALLCGACAPAPRPVSEERPPAAAGPGPAPPQEPPASSPAPPAQAATAASPAPAPARPPAPAEVRAALARTYRGAVAFDEREPRAAVGDFDGDGSEDLIVAARPAEGRAAELNEELANWIVYDPLTVRPPDPRDFDPHQGVQKLPAHTVRPRVEQSDELLVVVHGYGAAGWRDPQAQQTYLLKNVSGTGLRAQHPTEARAAAARRPPRLRGYVLRERLGGGEGFLYWTGAGYGWWKD
ncbi:MAG TPA: hypothetical protein VF736_03110 [Pyrinomonadaceae bacterium]|jgi:hypothetical protein